MERQRLHVIAREVIYPHLSPQARAEEAAKAAAEQAASNKLTTPINPYPPSEC